MATDDDRDTCKCGAPTRLNDTTLRKGRRVIGCKACLWSGRPAATRPVVEAPRE